jgi:hypothetical protein
VEASARSAISIQRSQMTSPACSMHSISIAAGSARRPIGSIRAAGEVRTRSRRRT